MRPDNLSTASVTPTTSQMTSDGGGQCKPLPDKALSDSKAGFENRCALGYRGFESHHLRSMPSGTQIATQREKRAET